MTSSCFLKSLVTVVVFTASNAILWSSLPEEGGTITACLGSDVSVPWSFTTSTDETVIGITWFLEGNDGQRTVFASLTEGEFFPLSRQNVQFVPNAGFRLQNASLNDRGNYSVSVNTLDGAGHVTRSTRSAFVETSTPPVWSGDQLVARRSSGPVRDNVTGTWHVTLECGHFLDRGHPPVNVEWVTPSGAVYTDSNYQNGYFVLPLQSVESGNYTCSLSHQSPASQCIANVSMLLPKAAVKVDDDTLKLTVVEANQRELMDKDQVLRQENEELRSLVQNLTQRLNQLEQALHLKVRNPATCIDVKLGGGVSGVHTLIQDSSTIKVYCDQDTDGGGWTVFQRRQDGSVNFFRNWTEYTHGFGDLNGEFWLGLDHLHLLTSSGPYELRVDLEAFNGTRAFAAYSGFRIGDNGSNYTLYFDAFLGGNAGDSLTDHKGHEFSTQNHGNELCANDWHGAWWYINCFTSNLNGIYTPNSTAPPGDGIIWSSFTGVDVSLKRTEMKMRPM